MADNIVPGTTNVSVEFRVDTVVAITNFRLGYIRSTLGDGTSYAETVAGSNLTALASINTGHTDNAGIYLSTAPTSANQFIVRVDFPDAAFAAGANKLVCTLYDGSVNVAAKEYTLIRDLVGSPYNLEDGSTPATLTDMLSTMSEKVPANGDFDRSVNSLESLGEKLDNVGLVGTAINRPAESITVSAGNIISGTVANTRTLDGVYQQVEDVAGTMDFYYEFNIGGVGVPVNGTWTGRLNGSNDIVIIQAYDWDGAAFEQVGSIEGINGTSDTTIPFTLYPDHVGTGANLGLIRIRFFGTGLTSADIFTDQLFVSFAVINVSVGYEGGKVWVDTVNGNPGTESFVNGTADNPVLTWAEAQTIASNVGLQRFEIENASSIVLDAPFINKTMEGAGYTLDFNGQDISGSVFFFATCSGTAISSGAPPSFESSTFLNVNMPPSNGITCGFAGTFTIGSPGSFVFGNSATFLPDGNFSTIDFGALLNSSDFTLVGYMGGAVRLLNAGAGTGLYTFTMTGQGSVIIDASCSADTLVSLGGTIALTDNAVGISYDVRAQTIPTSIDAELTTQHGAGSWQGAGSGGGGVQKFVASGETIIPTTGVVGSFVDTQNIGVSDLQLTMTSGVLDYELLFNVGADHQGLSVTLKLTTFTRNNRFADVQIYDYNAAGFVTFLVLDDLNGIFQDFAIGGASNDFIDTNGDIRMRFLQTSFGNGDQIVVDHAVVSTQTSVGTIPSAEEIALAVDGQLSATHGQSSWEGDWIKQTSIDSIITPDTVFTVAPKLGSDITKAGIIIARVRDGSGNDDFMEVVSYVESTGVMTVAANPDFALAVGDRLDLAVEIGGAVINTLETIDTNIGTPTDIDGGGANLSGNLRKLADDSGGTSFDATLDSQKALRGSQDTIVSNQSIISGQITDVKSDTTAILVDTGTTLPNNQANIEAKVDAVKVDTGQIITDVAAVKSDTDAILTDTSVTIPALIAALNDLSDAEVWSYAVRTLTSGANLNDISPAEVNAEMVDVIRTDTTGEPGQGKPLETTSLQEKIDYLYKFAINKMDQNDTTKQVYNYAGTVVDQKSTVNYTAPTFTDGEFNSGP